MRYYHLVVSLLYTFPDQNSTAPYPTMDSERLENVVRMTCDLVSWPVISFENETLNLFQMRRSEPRIDSISDNYVGLRSTIKDRQR